MSSEEQPLRPDEERYRKYNAIRAAGGTHEDAMQVVLRLHAEQEQATATAPAASNDGGEASSPPPPLTPAQRKQEGRIKGGLTTWNLYRRVPSGRKKLPRFNRKGEAGQPRGSEQRRDATPSGSRAGNRR